MTETEEILKAMLKENTGRHMLDSGGAYGRNWERNQDIDFDSLPPTEWKFSVWSHSRDDSKHLEIEFTHNVYHWLKERLTYCQELDELFHWYANEPEEADNTWSESLQDFYYWYNTVVEDDSFDTILDGVNTYNNEDALSQVLQYWEYESDKYGRVVILQIHGGCDVRGGYTAPRFFTAYDEYPLHDNAAASMWCLRDYKEIETLFGKEYQESHGWSTDDTCSWYGNNYESDLSTYDFEQVEVFNPVDFRQGTLYVDSEGNGYCPLCGSKLEIGFH